MNKPVPTAVPPNARKYKRGNVSLILSMLYLSCVTYPLNSCPSVKGVASWVWVLPIFIMWANSLAFLSIASWRFCKLGRRCLLISTATAMCMAVGNVSFELWLLLTWSLGCTGVLEPSFPPEMWWKQWWEQSQLPQPSGYLHPNSKINLQFVFFFFFHYKSWYIVVKERHIIRDSTAEV